MGVIIILVIVNVSHQFSVRFFRWNLSNSNSLHVPRTPLSILADFSSNAFLMLAILPLGYKSVFQVFGDCFKDTNYNWHCHLIHGSGCSFFRSQTKSKYFPLFSISPWFSETAISISCLFLPFLFIQDLVFWPGISDLFISQIISISSNSSCSSSRSWLAALWIKKYCSLEFHSLG